MEKFAFDRENRSKKYGIKELFSEPHLYRNIGAIDEKKYIFGYNISNHHVVFNEMVNELGQYNLALSIVDYYDYKKVHIGFIDWGNSIIKFNSFQYECVVDILKIIKELSNDISFQIEITSKLFSNMKKDDILVLCNYDYDLITEDEEQCYDIRDIDDVIDDLEFEKQMALGQEKIEKAKKELRRQRENKNPNNKVLSYFKKK